MSGQLIVHCCWAAPLQQPAYPPVILNSHSWVALVVEDASVLLRTATPSDCCFDIINVPYLL